MWGAAWLYRATRDVQYLQYLERNGAELGGATITARTLSWDDKYAGAQVLAAKVPETLLDAFFSSMKSLKASLPD